MQTKVKAVVVAKPMSEVVAHNTKNALLIECGMADTWEQCPRYAEREAREAREKAAHEAKMAEHAAQLEVVDRIHREACAKYNVPVDTNEMKYSLNEMNEASSSRWRCGAKVGYTLHIGWNTNCYRANLRFESGTRMLKESSLVKAFEKRAELVAGWLELERKEKEAKQRAAEVMAPDFLETLHKLTLKPRLQAEMSDDGKVRVTYESYNSYAAPSNRYSRLTFLKPMPMSQWQEYVAELQRHKAAVEALLNAVK
jgi:hypothetical protein